MDNETKWAFVKSEAAKLSSLPFLKRVALAKELSAITFPLHRFIFEDKDRTREFHDLEDSISAPLLQSTDLIQQASKDYFEHKYNATRLDFYPKIEGVQLGATMKMTFLTQDAISKEIFFFIKTHRERSTKSSASKQAADLKELFIYKMLEIAGFGPKAHFYGHENSSLILLIATQDLAFTKRSNVKKSFSTYGDIRDSLQLNPDIIFNFSLFDILARIFFLYDATTNPGNIGQVSVAEEGGSYFKWKIVDFRIPSLDRFVLPEIFQGFLNGNGMFNYTRHFATICCDRPEAERLQIGKAVISLLHSGASRRSKSQPHPPLLSAIDQACEFVKQFAASNSLLVKQISKLEQYVMDVKINFTVLAEQINNR